MKDYVNEHLQATFEMEKGHQKIRDRLICVDGVDLSIQAGEYLYSTPRMDGMNHYVCVEVGYPSIRPPNTWRQYAEEWDLAPIPRIRALIGTVYYAIYSGLFGWSKKHGFGISKFTIRHAWEQFIKGKACVTIYPYIPIELVNEFIAEHGGVNYD